MSHEETPIEREARLALTPQRHAPIIREYGAEAYGLSCTCGHDDPYLFSTKESTAYGWLDHVVDHSLKSSGLDAVLGDRFYTVGVAWDS